jgi:hypothetical protein
MGTRERRLGRLVAALTTALATGLVLAAAAAADTGDSIPAGFDLFETDPEQTVFKFEGQTTIPANFFDQGSEPFQGQVRFGGDPIVSFQGTNAGDADTVVEREQLATVPQPGTQSEPIPIELLQLSLVAMAPIKVIVNGSPQLWDVTAAPSPSRPSRGEMAIEVASATADGGTFDSRLQVYPKFTFRRLSDNTTKELDVGALPDNVRPDEPLDSTNAVWRDGCIPPAFVTPLSEHFCPGQTIAGKKKLTIEESQFARHGVLPVQPRLEHFACYATTRTNKGTTTVKLKDQFGSREAKVDRTAQGQLCNPARKNREATVKNRRDHLRCYQTDESKAVGRTALLRNQYGPFKASVREAVGLCVPSKKTDLTKAGGPKAPTFKVDHFQCYAIRVSGKFQNRKVKLKDQFVTRTLEVKKPNRLCAPVNKNGEGIMHRVRHLACYEASTKPEVKRNIRVNNQFGKEEFSTKRLASVCIPTLKVLVKR